MKNALFYFVYTLLLLFPCLEIALRIVQYQPYHYTPFQISSTPEFCLLPHPRLGFALNPGQYEVTINHGLTYSVTHSQDSLRISRVEESEASLPILALFGCSYTYGIGLPDSLSYGYVLQSILSEYEIQTLAVPGYGTVQSYLQLLKMINNGRPPSIAVMHFADFHHDRNALTPLFRQTLHMGFERSHQHIPQLMRSSKVPYMTEDSIGWEDWSQVYHNWPGREKWPSVHFLQEVADQIGLHQLDSHSKSCQIFFMIHRLCQLHNIRLIVAGITSNQPTQQTLDSLTANGIETLDMSLDLTNTLYNNYPFDTHPNAIAHLHFAVNMKRYLSL
ncbi:MAG: hypothetical protein AAF587_14330 [Bacteroidota bacterium]